jgi:Trypsin-like peptidase domain
VIPLQVGALLLLIGQPYGEGPKLATSLEDARAAVGIIAMLESTGRPDALGTGFAVSPTGIILTAAHVVRDVRAGSKLVFIGDGGSPQTALLVQRLDFESDIGVLKAEKPPRRYLATSAEKLPDVGRRALFLGFPAPTIEAGLPRISVTRCSIGAVETVGTPDRGVTQLIKIDHAVMPGYSGGPLLHESSYALVGVIARSLNERIALASADINIPQGYGYAVPLVSILPLLNGVGDTVTLKDTPGDESSTLSWFHFRLRRELSDHLDALAFNNSMAEQLTQGRELIAPPARLRETVWRELWDDPRAEVVLGSALITELRSYYFNVERYNDIIASRENIRSQIALQGRLELVRQWDGGLRELAGRLGTMGANIQKALKATK